MLKVSICLKNTIYEALMLTGFCLVFMSSAHQLSDLVLTRSFGATCDDRCISVCRMQNCGFILLYQSATTELNPLYPFENPDESIESSTLYLVLLNNEGVEQRRWVVAKNYCGWHHSVTIHGVSVCESNDNGLVVLYNQIEKDYGFYDFVTSPNYKYSSFAKKYDLAGNCDWTYHIMDETAKGVISSQDNGYAVFTEKKIYSISPDGVLKWSFFSNFIEEDSLESRTTPVNESDLFWCGENPDAIEEYLNPPVQCNIQNLLATSDSGFVVTANKQKQYYFKAGKTFKISSQGKLEWALPKRKDILYVNSESYGSGFCTLAKDSSTSRSIYILAKSDKYGKELWNRVFRDSGYTFSNITELPCDKMLISGTTTVYTGTSDPFIMKVNPDGYPLWSKAIKTQVNDDLCMVFALSVNDFALFGTTSAIGNGGNDVFFTQTSSKKLCIDIQQLKCCGNLLKITGSIINHTIYNLGYYMRGTLLTHDDTETLLYGPQTSYIASDSKKNGYLIHRLPQDFSGMPCRYSLQIKIPSLSETTYYTTTISYAK